EFRPGRWLAPPLELQETLPHHFHPRAKVKDRSGSSLSRRLVDPVDDLWGGVLAERRDSVGETHVVVTTGRNPERELARHVAGQEVRAEVVHKHRGNRQIGLQTGVPLAERPLQFGEERTLDQVVDAEGPAASLPASRPLRLQEAALDPALDSARGRVKERRHLPTLKARGVASSRQGWLPPCPSSVRAPGATARTLIRAPIDWAGRTP